MCIRWRGQFRDQEGGKEEGANGGAALLLLCCCCCSAALLLLLGGDTEHIMCGFKGGIFAIFAHFCPFWAFLDHFGLLNCQILSTLWLGVKSTLFIFQSRKRL